MTNQEKELEFFIDEILRELDVDPKNSPNKLSKAIIAKYPQILAKEIFSGDMYINWDGFEEYCDKNVQIFIREVK